MNFWCRTKWYYWIPNAHLSSVSTRWFSNAGNQIATVPIPRQMHESVTVNIGPDFFLCTGIIGKSEVDSSFSIIKRKKGTWKCFRCFGGICLLKKNQQKTHIFFVGWNYYSWSLKILCKSKGKYPAPALLCICCASDG